MTISTIKMCLWLQYLLTSSGHFVVDGVWREWSAWGECSLACGGGNRTRNRECIQPQYNGADCEGPSKETEVCNEHPCPGML